MKTKNTKPRPRPERPLFVFKFKIGQFTWIAACRRCSFAKGYYSHPLALKAALFHHDDCLYKTTEQTCHADVLLEIANQKEKDNQ